MRMTLGAIALLPLLTGLAALSVRAAPPPYPDLIVQRTTLTVSATDGVSALSAIKNVGGADAPPSRATIIRVVEITAQSYSQHPTEIYETQNVPALAVGQEAIVHWRSPFPNSVDAQWVVVADAGPRPNMPGPEPNNARAVGRVIEAGQTSPDPDNARWAAGELNNALVVPFVAGCEPGNYAYLTPATATAAEQPVSPVRLGSVGRPPPVKTPKPAPDLVVARCSFAAHPGETGVLDVNVEVRNLGDKPAGPSVLGTLLLRDTLDRVLAPGQLAAVPALAPGEGVTVSLAVFVPQPAVQLLVYADAPMPSGHALGQVNECSGGDARPPARGEVNNVLVVPLDPDWPPPFVFVNPLALRR